MYKYLFPLLFISYTEVLAAHTEVPASMDEAAIRIIKQMSVDELKRELFYGQPLKVIVKNLRGELKRYNLDIGIELTGNVDDSLRMSIRADIDYANVLEVLERIKLEFHSSVIIKSNKILILRKSN